MGPALEFTTGAEDGTVVLAVKGEIDLHTVPELREQLLGQLTTGTPIVVLDMADVSFIDSTGLSVLITALKRARSLGGDVKLRTPSHQTYKVLELTRLHQVFEIEGVPDGLT